MTEDQSGRTDRWSRYAPGVLVGAAIVALAIATVRRIAELVGSTDVPVRVDLPATAAQAPLGPGGGDVAVVIDAATVALPHPGGWTLVALWAQPIEAFLVWSALLALAGLFLVSAAAGRGFHRRGGQLALAGAIVLAAHWLLDAVLRGVINVGALAEVGHEDAAFALELSVLPLLGVLLLGAAGAALERGYRLEVEVDGLV